jgi:chemotaxis methyl-accepting protein methylase
VWQFEQYLEQVTENLIFDELADEGQLFLGENENVSKRSNKHLEHLIVRDFVFEFPL